MNFLLSLSIWVPIIFGVCILFTSTKQVFLAKILALIGSVVGFLLTTLLYANFDFSTGNFQSVEYQAWIPSFNIHYHLGIDGFSLPLILLTSFTTIVIVLAGWKVIQKHIAQYYSIFLIMSGLIIGVFSSLDALLFYVFWEAMLIPLFLIIGIWGGPNRVYAALKFFLYTLLGSLLMLVAFIYLYQQTGGFSLEAYYQLPLHLNIQILLFIAFFVAFAVKIPMWPVHTWLPDAHVEAPTGGSVILAAIALKLGAYGFLRFAIPIAPDAAHFLAPFMITLSLIAVVYIAFVAIVQEDMKKLIAYSSISHMGFVTLGLFIFDIWGIEGAMVQMVSHGFISGALFLSVGILYDRIHSRQIADYGGVVNKMPQFTAWAVLFAMANAGLPGTSGFVGEFMIILGAMKFNFWIAACAATTLILGAAYTLWMVKRVFFGSIVHTNIHTLADLDKRELFILTALGACILLFGCYPDLLVQITHSTATHFLEQITRTKLP